MEDLRFKLTEKDREEIKKLWNDGYKNYSYLARRFNVHPKTIKRVLYPEYKKACNDFNKANWRRFKPSKFKHNEAMRNYRKRKKDKKLVDKV